MSTKPSADLGATATKLADDVIGPLRGLVVQSQSQTDRLEALYGQLLGLVRMVCLYVIAVSGYKLSKLDEVVLSKFEHTSHLLSLSITLALFAANVKDLSTAKLFKAVARLLAVVQLLLWAGCALVFDEYLHPSSSRLAMIISSLTGVFSRSSVSTDAYDPKNDVPLGMATYFFYLVAEKMVSNFLRQSKEISDKTKEKYEEILKKHEKKDK